MTTVEATNARARHPITGRFMAGDCERDCLDYCAGPCGVFAEDNDDDRRRR